MVALKTCSTCKQKKPPSAFALRRSRNPFKTIRRAQCKECENRRAREHLKEHPEAAEHYRQWQRDNPRKRNLYNWNLKLRALKLVGEKCVYCDESNPLVLTINHKNGGGTAERKTIPGLRMYAAIVKGRRNLDDLETTCMNCNFVYETRIGRWHRNMDAIITPFVEAYYREHAPQRQAGSPDR